MKYYLVSWRTSSIVFAQNLEVQPSCSAAFTCNHFLLAYNFTNTFGDPDVLVLFPNFKHNYAISHPCSSINNEIRGGFTT